MWWMVTCLSSHPMDTDSSAQMSLIFQVLPAAWRSLINIFYFHIKMISKKSWIGVMIQPFCYFCLSCCSQMTTCEITAATHAHVKCNSCLIWFDVIISTVASAGAFCLIGAGCYSSVCTIGFAGREDDNWNPEWQVTFMVNKHCIPASIIASEEWLQCCLQKKRRKEKRHLQKWAQKESGSECVSLLQGNSPCNAAPVASQKHTSYPNWHTHTPGWRPQSLQSDFHLCLLF